ncbi:MAG: Pectinesterase [Clostridia bacterium]|jgi:pectinesterase|nr:Pectinesterase [Clostridia bacterium]
MIIIAQDGSGDYTSLQAALKNIPLLSSSPTAIYIKKGIYHEKIHIKTPYITLIGEDPVQTIITYDDYALKEFPDGTTYGTFNSYTIFIGAHDFTAKNITFQNHAGPGKKVGQAIAAYVGADRACFKNCRFIGNQDTLFTGPLPPSPLIPHSFRGPQEHAERLNTRQYYEDCTIQGDIDFIFGSATACFYNCEIFSNNLGEAVNGYITAPSTPSGQPYGYIFRCCRLTSNCPKETVYLGRPWRLYAHAVFIDCEMGSHITRSGWHDWDKPESHQTTQFAEFNSHLANEDHLLCRASWSKILTPDKAKFYTFEKALSGSDGWQPWL